jgi:hypothetical protein
MKELKKKYIYIYIYTQLNGTEYYSRRHQICSHLMDSQHFMEPKGSLPHSQELPTCFYPELDHPSLHRLEKIHLNVIHPLASWSS